MSATSRDKKLLLILIPVIAIAGYWFLLLGPKRAEVGKLTEEQAKQERKADEATATADRLKGAASNFRGEYTTLVRLGKAVPSSVDMPSLLVQLNRAARGTGIKFGSITVGDRASATAAAGGGATPPPAGGPGGSTPPPAAAGGQPAQSSAGQSAETAGNAAAGANQSSEARAQDPTNAQTSTPASQGAVPVGGGAPSQTAPPGGAGAGEAASSGVPGLDSVPLEMSFRGNYFDLARFFHRLKRFVRVANEKIRVQGRLLTIDGLSFSGGARLVAVVKATVYLVPKQQGVSAGATPSGPQATPAGSSGSVPEAASSSPAPTATATPR